MIKKLIGVFVVLLICLIVFFSIKSDSKIILYGRYAIIPLLVINSIIIGYVIIKYSKKSYSDDYKKYEKLKLKDSWKDAESIIHNTKVDNFANMPDQQKKVYDQCYAFTNKYYKDYKELYDPKNPTKSDKPFDYYAPSIECSNLAKMTQKKATDKLNESHDKCINALKNTDTEKYDTYINNLTNDYDYKNKETQYKECDEIMKQI